MFVCCMFLELGLGSVWNLNCHGFLLEPSFLEFWFKCLAFFAPLCSSACHVGVRRACCVTPGASLCLAMDGLAIQEVCSQASRSGDPFSISRKPFGRTGVSCDDRAIRHNNLVHQEDCAQWSSNRVEPNVFLHASSWPCFAQRGMSIPSRTWSQRAPLMSDMLPALMTEPWMSF